MISEDFGARSTFAKHIDPSEECYHDLLKKMKQMPNRLDTNYNEKKMILQYFNTMIDSEVLAIVELAALSRL